MSGQLLSSKISHIAGLLRNGSISSSELCELCLQRTTRTARLNAFITVSAELAKTQAIDSTQRFKKETPKSRLDGIPVAVKDNFATLNVRTTCASKMLSNYSPPYDSAVADRLMNKSGAILLGKTNMDEFAMGSGTIDSYFGPSISPWSSGLPFKIKSTMMNKTCEVTDGDDWFISGGSSGGSAIAVATGAAFAAIGTDTGGSTRHPAALVGVYGMKPSYGSISRHGLIPLTHSMDTPGIITRSVEDLSLVLNAISGYDPQDSTSLKEDLPRADTNIDIANLVIGIPDEYAIPGMSEEVKRLWSDTCDTLSNLGAKLVRVSLPHTKYCLSSYAVIKACDVASNFSCYDGVEYGFRSENDSSTEEMYASSRSAAFNEVVKGFIMSGNYFLMRDNINDYYNQAARVRRLISEDFNTVFNHDGVHVLLTPVTLTEAPTYAQWTQKENREKLAKEDFCTLPANLAGLPALSIPCRLSSLGLPLSLQLIGPHLKDHFVLSVAQILENILDFPFLEFDDE